MPAAFKQTTRAMHRDRSRWTLPGLGLGIVLLGAWSVWFVVADMAVIEATQRARVEVRRDAWPVEVVVSGELAAFDADLGEEVARGDVLARLDTDGLELRIEEHREQIGGLKAQREALDGELELRRELVEAQSALLAARLDELKAARSKETTSAYFARTRSERYKQLAEKGYLQELEALKAEIDVNASISNLKSLDARSERVRREIALDRIRQRARIRELEQKRAVIEQEIETLRVKIKQLEHDLDDYIVRAPTAGRIGELNRKKVGAVVSQGERLATIVPEEALNVIAEFRPDQAVGRIHPGDRGLMRVAGFPWSQFGVVRIEVERIAREPASDRIRVECAVIEPIPPEIPLQHALPGSVEVEVERASPAELVLRSIGRALD